MSEDFRLWIEGQLPEQFIYDLGLYLQTCAHIETSACSLICNLEAQTQGRSFDAERFHFLRKLPIKDLIKAMLEAFEAFGETFAEDKKSLVEWIETYQLNRHIAAHGAFFSEKGSNEIRVLYTHQRRNHGKKVYDSEEAVLSREQVFAFLKDADRILRTMVGLDQDARDGKLDRE